MFDDPLEMLTLCHEKVRRFARLTDRIGEHVSKHGADDVATEAAGKVLRYFNIAAPLHHDDEDLNVYPELLALRDDVLDAGQKTVLNASIHRLQLEHDELAGLWREVRSWLEQIEQGNRVPAPENLKRFARTYVRHADDEEAEIYPFIRLLDNNILREIGRNMAERRGAKHTIQDDLPRCA